VSVLNSRMRTALPIVVASIGISVAMYFLLSYQPRVEARRGFESKAQSLSRMLAQIVRAAVEFDDQAAAQRDLDNFKSEQSLAYIAVRKGDRTVMAFTKQDNLDKVPELPTLLGTAIASEDLDEMHHVAVPISGQGKEIGWLQAGFTLAEVRSAYRATALTSLLVSLVVLLIGLILAYLVGRAAANRGSLLNEIASTSARLRISSENIQGACNEQAASTTEQAAAVDETRRTMSSLLEAAKRIADASQEVFKNADHTAQTTLNISEAIKQLTTQAQKISDISEVIRSISDKSDLLALNASLEGTKAGEAGRGFTLVAAEMRRLAESVMAAAREIKQLASNIRTASDSSVQAAEEGRDLAGRTSESAREITLVTVQQRNATEQVTRSMDEVSQLLAKSAESTRATESAAQLLSGLADQLGRLTASIVSSSETRT
jgi:hypothetical protein